MSASWGNPAGSIAVRQQRKVTPSNITNVDGIEAGTPLSRDNSRQVQALALGLAIFACLFVAIRVWRGYWFLGFVDESEHLLGGKMLNEGATLYRSFVS